MAAISSSGATTAVTNNTSYDHLFKIVMIGDAGVGKSCILLRFTDDRFEDGQLSTIGVDLRVKFMELEKKRLKITVWDTAGQERFRTLTSSYFHRVHALILVYDVTQRTSFTNLDMWNGEIEAHTESSKVVRVLVGNKVDLREVRQVTRAEGEEWARAHSMLFVECSAKTKAGVSQVFTECVMQILAHTAALGTSSTGGSTGVKLATEEDANNKDEGSCCG